VTLTLSPRTRAIMIIGLLAIAALAAGVLLLGRSQSSSQAAPPATTAPAPAPKTADTPAKPARPATTRKANDAPGTPPTAQLPAAIAQALAANRVVVVALFAPKAKTDATAVREASAGAALGGAAFVAVDVTGTDVDSLNHRYGAMHDPAVLVLRPPGDLIVRIDGFADRDTVAQAAANAAS
jgi:hypothetical protein